MGTTVKLKWRDEDSAAALLRGWDLFSCDDGRYRIYHVDDSSLMEFANNLPEGSIPSLESDEVALELVKQGVEANDGLCLRAYVLDGKRW